MSITLSNIVQKRLGKNFIRQNFSNDDGEHVLIEKSALLKVVTFGKKDPDINVDFLIDICPVQFNAGQKPYNWLIDKNNIPQFEIIYSFRSSFLQYNYFISTFLYEDLSIISLYKLFAAANWLEREIWDMFGIFPIGHPFRYKLLRDEEQKGHPLHKSFNKSF